MIGLYDLAIADALGAASVEDGMPRSPNAGGTTSALQASRGRE